MSKEFRIHPNPNPCPGGQVTHTFWVHAGLVDRERRARPCDVGVACYRKINTQTFGQLTRRYPPLGQLPLPSLSARPTSSGNSANTESPRQEKTSHVSDATAGPACEQTGSARSTVPQFTMTINRLIITPKNEPDPGSRLHAPEKDSSHGAKDTSVHDAKGGDRV